MDYTDTILEDVKTMLGKLEDDVEPKLKIYIRNATNEIELFLDIEEIDPRLADIVQQMVIAKYRKELYEGSKSVSEEGLSFTFDDNDLEPFKDMLLRWQNSQRAKQSQGKVWTVT